jgi:hypothetical protein
MFTSLPVIPAILGSEEAARSPTDSWCFLAIPRAYSGAGKQPLGISGKLNFPLPEPEVVAYVWRQAQPSRSKKGKDANS